MGSNKELELIGLYYSNLGDGYFLDALKNFSNGEGFGIGEISQKFLERNLGYKAEVDELLLAIKNRLNLG
ncbi:hypothetical protein J2T17_006363 [Paenibacillus mucilaginosus]|uniref:hypothetical protein n=1 Tax=Paenibacillus mucilaginosus TaxID=61624 RepID=UPI003D1F19D8